MIQGLDKWRKITLPYGGGSGQAARLESPVWLALLPQPRFNTASLSTATKKNQSFESDGAAFASGANVRNQ